MSGLVASIPEELHYIIIPIKQFLKSFQHYTGDLISEFSGYYCYVCPKNSSSFKTLKKKAEYDIAFYKKKNSLNDVITPVVHLISNLKLKSLSIISDVYERSGYYFRKVLVPKENFPVELNITEDLILEISSNILYETSINTVIDKGLIKNSEFVWTFVNSQTQLVRVGSELHKKLEIKESENVYDKIPKEFLNPFTVYSDRQNNEFLYLGNVFYYAPKKVSEKKNVSYGRTTYEYKLEYVVKQSPVWLPFRVYDKTKSYEEQLQKELSCYFSYIFNIKDKAVYKKTYSFVPVPLTEVSNIIYAQHGKDATYFYGLIGKSLTLSETSNIDISHLSFDIQDKIKNGEVVTSHYSMDF